MKMPLFFQLNQMDKTGASIADIELAANRSSIVGLFFIIFSIADIELAANRSPIRYGLHYFKSIADIELAANRS